MPTPVSATEISAMPSVIAARTSTRPPSGVNLRALERRFRRTCFTFRSSPLTMPIAVVDGPSQPDSTAARPFAHEGQGVVDGSGQAEVRQLQLHPARLDLGEI